MRKGLGVGLALAGLVMGGCSSPGEPAPVPEPPEAAVPSEVAPVSSARTSPVKSLDLAEPCVIVTFDQAKHLGADQEPEPGESNGKPGCDYLQGEAGGGFMIFVAADRSETMQKFAEKRSRARIVDIGGYPTAEIGDETSCLHSVDVSDQGALFLNTLVSDGKNVPCELSRRFAEAALQNLPNA